MALRYKAPSRSETLLIALMIQSATKQFCENPYRFTVPLDLLGRGHRWPDAPKLDSETRDKILWREIGRAP